MDSCCLNNNDYSLYIYLQFTISLKKKDGANVFQIMNDYNIF